MIQVICFCNLFQRGKRESAGMLPPPQSVQTCNRYQVHRTNMKRQTWFYLLIYLHCVINVFSFDLCVNHSSGVSFGYNIFLLIKSLYGSFPSKRAKQSPTGTVLFVDWICHLTALFVGVWQKLPECCITATSAKYARTHDCCYKARLDLID